jgi:hypothetical protein
MSDYEIGIGQSPVHLGVWIMIYRSEGQKRFVLQPTEKGEFEEKEYGVFEQVAIPSISLDRELLPELLKALLDYGVKSPDKSFIEGENKATKNHLEDMRKLIFKDDYKNLND